MTTRAQQQREQLSEALGSLRAARRVLLSALDDIGDASLGGADGSPVDLLHDAAIDLETKLDALIKQARAARDALGK